MPLATKFNEVVAIDLKEFCPGVYFIHMIDMHTRFTRSKVIKRKLPKVIIDSIITTWRAAGLDPAKKYLVANGGEFNNPEFREMAEQFNVQVCSTAAYSPWQMEYVREITM